MFNMSLTSDLVSLFQQLVQMCRKELLQPIQTWSDTQSYNEAADSLADMFVDNFKRYEAGVSEAVNASSPKSLVN